MLLWLLYVLHLKLLVFSELKSETIWVLQTWTVLRHVVSDVLSRVVYYHGINSLIVVCAIINTILKKGSWIDRYRTVNSIYYITILVIITLTSFFPIVTLTFCIVFSLSIRGIRIIARTYCVVVITIVISVCDVFVHSVVTLEEVALVLRVWHPEPTAKCFKFLMETRVFV